MSNSRRPLITGYSDNILNREQNIALTAYAIGKTFTGATLPDDTSLDACVQPGIWRITNNIVQNPSNMLPVDDIAGFLQVLEVNHDEDTSTLKDARRVRQIVYPDNTEDASPYTRVGEAATLTDPIMWSEWGMMGGGGSLRRIVINETTPRNEAGEVIVKNNVMYESFGPHTVRLPDPASVPVGTCIGVEQHMGVGKVICGEDVYEQTTDATFREGKNYYQLINGQYVKVAPVVIGDPIDGVYYELTNTKLVQVTDPAVDVTDDDVLHPWEVGTWTRDPYNTVSYIPTTFNNVLDVVQMAEVESGTQHAAMCVVRVDTTDIPDYLDNADGVSGYYYPTFGYDIQMTYNGITKRLIYHGEGYVGDSYNGQEQDGYPYFLNSIWESADAVSSDVWRIFYSDTPVRQTSDIVYAGDKWYYTYNATDDSFTRITPTVGSAISGVCYEWYTKGHGSAAGRGGGGGLYFRHYDASKGVFVCERILEGRDANGVEIDSYDYCLTPILDVWDWEGALGAGTKLALDYTSLDEDTWYERRTVLDNKSVIITTDSVFAENKTYYTYENGSFVQATVVPGEPVVGTYYQSSGAIIYLVYNQQRHTWEFIRRPNLLDTEIYFESEHTVATADAIAYVFECIINDAGEREWALDVTHNYAKAVNILSDRIRELEAGVISINKYETPTFGRKTVYHDGYISISTNYYDADLSDEIVKGNAVRATSDIYYYDHIIRVVYSDSTRECVLPDVRRSPMGASITYELVNTSNDPVNFTIRATGTDESQVFAVAANTTVVAAFQCSRSNGYNVWSLLTVGGDTSTSTGGVNNASSTSNYVIQEAQVGDFRWWFGTRDAIPTGWLVCDGTSFDAAEYPELYAFLGSAKLPNMIGRFIKAVSSNALATQDAGLPNINGTFSGVGQAHTSSATPATLTGSFYRVNTTNKPSEGVKVVNTDGDKDDYFGFDASLSSDIYGKSDTVTPANIAAVPIIRAKPTMVSTSLLTSHIGMMFWVPKTIVPNGALFLNGQLLQNCDKNYPDFWEWITSNTNSVRKITEAVFQSEKTQYGFCGGFVIDETAKSVRLADLTGAYLSCAGSAGVCGMAVHAGIPDITGSITSTDKTDSGVTQEMLIYADQITRTGALAVDNHDRGTVVPISASGDNPGFRTILMKASSGQTDTSGNIVTDANMKVYGKSNTVTPPTVLYHCCIQVKPLEVKVIYEPRSVYVPTPNRFTPDYANSVSFESSDNTIPATGWTAPSDGMLLLRTKSPNDESLEGARYGVWVRNAAGTTLKKIAVAGSILAGSTTNIPLAEGNVISFTDDTDSSNIPINAQFDVLTFVPYVSRESESYNIENGYDNNIRYRKHPDGYLEVWGKSSAPSSNGNVVINFPANAVFKDTEFNVSLSIQSAVTTNQFAYVVDANTTTSSITLWRTAKSTVHWKACGYWK